MVETLPILESAALPKPMVAVIGDCQDMLGPIESCKARLEFVFLNAISEEPDFLSRSQIRGVVFCGLKWFARFRETETFDELGIVVAVNDLNEFSAALEAGASALLIKPLSGNALLRQIENQLHLVGERKRSDELLSGQKKVLEMMARGAAFDSTIEALALLVERVEPDVRCAISTINSDGAAFSNVYAPSLPRPCKVRLQQMQIGPDFLNPNRPNADHHFAILCTDLAGDGQWNRSAWAQALTAEGFRSCWFVPILDSKRRPLAVFSVFGRNSAKLATSDSLLAQTVIHLTAIALEKRAREEELGTERERLSLALAGGELGIWNWDLITNELEWSEQCKLLFGHSPDARVTFEDFLAVLHPKDRDRTMKAIEESIRNDVPYDIEYRVLRTDGAVRWIAATGRTFKDDFDRPMRMGGVARDVTERRQFDEASQENQYQLRTALNAAELARREAETATRWRFLAMSSGLL